MSKLRLSEVKELTQENTAVTGRVGIRTHIHLTPKTITISLNQHEWLPCIPWVPLSQLSFFSPFHTKAVFSFASL